ncbi:hypothetical protein [Pseudoalteromonas piscicida]
MKIHITASCLILLTTLVGCGGGSDKNKKVEEVDVKSGVDTTTDNTVNVTESILGITAINMTNIELDHNYHYVKAVSDSHTEVKRTTYSIMPYVTSSDVFLPKINETVKFTLGFPGQNKVSVTTNNANNKEQLTTGFSTAFNEQIDDTSTLLVTYHNGETELSQSLIHTNFEPSSQSAIVIDAFDLSENATLNLEGKCADGQSANLVPGDSNIHHIVSCKNNSELVSLTAKSGSNSVVIDYKFILNHRYTLLLATDHENSIISTLISKDSF